MRHPIITSTLGAAVILVVAAAVLWAMPVHAAQCGKASWYGEQHQGRLMANGKPFNMHALTAASNSLPLGTRATVASGNRSVVVLITDRGGFGKYGRIIDLSKAAFARLAPIGQGVIRVCVD